MTLCMPLEITGAEGCDFQGTDAQSLQDFVMQCSSPDAFCKTIEQCT